jgi:hypothetical protein
LMRGFPQPRDWSARDSRLSGTLVLVQTSKQFPVEPFTRAVTLELGITPWQLSEALANRVVRRLLLGVYVRCDVRDSIALRCGAAALVIRRHSVVRDRTAAWLHGVDVLDIHELEVLPAVETCVGRGQEPTRRGNHAGGTRDLAPSDIQLLHGLLVTTPIRTMLDLGCSLSQRDALAALDAFMRMFGITRAQLEHAALRYRRRRGVVQLRRLIPLADPRAESPGESWTRMDLISAGLPSPELQWWVEVDGVPTFRLDLAYPRHKVAVEYDGMEFHTGTEQRARDQERRDWLRRHGWIVIVVRKGDFTNEAVERWTAEVRAALRIRTH